MKIPFFKRTVALTAAMALVLSYTVFPAEEAITAYASGNQSDSASVNTYQSSAPTVTAHPQDATAKPGEEVKFTVSATGTGTIKYQWYYKKLGASDWTIWNGRTTASIKPTSNASWNMMKVRCSVTDDNGSIFSNEATITIDQPLTILTQPENVTVKPNTPTKFSINAQGKGALKYQWYYKKDGSSDWTLWNGGTTASIKPTSNASWNMMKVRCSVTDDNGSVFSNAATVKIDQPLAILTQPQNVTVKPETPITISVKARGKGVLKYQWYYKKYGASDWTLWSGRTTASITPTSNASWNMMKVKCSITDENENAFSNAATVKIDQPLTILTQPKDVTTKAGQEVNLSVKAQGKGALKYQWYYKKYGASDWTLWNGRTTASINPTSNSSWNMMRIKCNVTDENGSVFSDVATIKIDQPLTILTQPKDITVKVGQETNFSVKAQGKGALNYQWYYKKAGASDWTLWKGRTTASIAPTANATWDLMQVRCRITDDSQSVFSDAAIITLDLPLAILAQPNDVTAKPDENVKFSVKAEGKGTLKYQWYFKKSDATEWTLWKGRTTASITPTSNSSWNMMQVRCTVTDSSGSIDSNAATIIIDQPLTILTQPKNITKKPSANAAFSVKAQGKGELKYQWYYKEELSEDWTVWTDRTSASISFQTDASWNMKQVRCMVTDNSGSIYSAAATVTIDQPLTILTQPNDVTVKVGAEVQLNVAAQGKGKLKYQWYYKKADSNTWELWNNCTSSSIALASVSDWNMMQVRCAVTDDAGSVYSRTVVITISQPLKINSVSLPIYIFPNNGETVKIDVKAQGTGALTYKWYYKNIDASAWTLWSEQKTASASFVSSSAWNNRQIYCAVADAAGSSVNTNPITVVTTSKMLITKHPEETIVELGANATFSVSVYGQTNLSYQWYYKKTGSSSWTTWNGKTSPTISATSDCTWHGMQVYCKITDSKNNSISSKSAYVMVTKQSDKRYFSRTITVKKNSTKIYSGVGTNTQVVGTVSANSSFTALEWDSDSNDTTWYSFRHNGRIVWIPRTSVNSTINYTSIPDRKFNNGGIPIIYLSPSKQNANLYAVGNTTEQEQMYRVANTLKSILEQEYYCSVYIPPTSLKLGLKNRAYDAYIRDSDVYLAIHSNSISNGVKMHGATGFYYPSCNQSYQLAQNIVNEMGKIEFQKSIVKNKLVNGMTAYENTGYGEVRDPSYYGIISVLAEVEYHHYEAPARWIINNNDKIARALANSLADTLGMQKKK